ncbi:MAG: hypothetical protein NWE75_06930 [Candidatus Bathyarchaeota archaeon]|nr:hypothetical protein [Candidatus Bathyarchaeota archaeon]
MEGITVSEVILDVDRSAVTINGLRIEDPKFYNCLVELDEEARINFVERALQVGYVVLQVMETETRVDYVRLEFERMRNEVESELEKIFSEKGSLLMALNQFLGKEGELKRILDDHFGDKGSVIYKILNPDDESTPLGKFRKQLQQELDADRDGTAFNKLKKDMDYGFEKVLIALGAAEAAEEEREKGTAKGGDFEDYVYAVLDLISRDFEDTVEFVGDDDGSLGKRVGDVLVRINPRDTGNVERNIVVEAKNASITLKGKSSFLKELDRAKENRGSHYAIGAVHESRIPVAIGSFRRYDGEKIICSVPVDDDPLALEIAYKVARAELVLSIMREEVRLDPSKLKDKVMEIQGQLDTIRAIKSTLTGATGKIDDAKGDLKKMETSIREIIGEILDMVKTGEEG